MDILAFIIGSAGAIMAVLAWGLIGAAGAKIKKLEADVESLRQQVESR